ncbi:MAG: hypothetical protein RIB84_09955 [Sneathiellaceae bacterium]
MELTLPGAWALTAREVGFAPKTMTSLPSVDMTMTWVWLEVSVCVVSPAVSVMVTVVMGPGFSSLNAGSAAAPRLQHDSAVDAPLDSHPSTVWEKPADPGWKPESHALVAEIPAMPRRGSG